MTPSVESDERLLTEKATARLLCVSSRTLQTWRSKGLGPPFVRVGRAIRYDRRRLIEWMNENTVEPKKAS
jgi:DNA-binding transcriptional MerR regulator